VGENVVRRARTASDRNGMILGRRGSHGGVGLPRFRGRVSPNEESVPMKDDDFCQRNSECDSVIRGGEPKKV
jgi:hypothetical protein